jgi:uncharacterized membrane protein YuzA (DUF378 family)
MKTINNILAGLFGLIAIAALIGVFTGATHQAFIFVIAAAMCLTLRADNKKATQ